MPAAPQHDAGMEKLRTLNALPYKEQAIWFLNAFWKQGPAFADNAEEAENVWAYKNKATELDRKGDEGCELDEFQAHRLLESIGKTLSVREMRNVLREADVDFNKMVSLTEFLIYIYKADWKILVDAPQGEMDETKLAEAQTLLDAAMASMEECSIKAKIAQDEEAFAVTAERGAMESEAAAVKAENEAKVGEAKAVVAENEAKKAEAAAIATETAAKEAESAAAAAAAAAVEMEKQAKGAEKDAIHAEMDAKTAEAAAETAETEAKASESSAFAKETEARDNEKKAQDAEDHAKDVEAQVANALHELQREEDSYNEQKSKLEATSTDDSLGTVKRNTAKAELAQLLASDPLPLQRAKINQEAVLRRQQKATKSAAAARVAATSSRTAAEESRVQAVSAREDAEQTRERAASRREAAVNTREAAEASRAKAEECRADAEARRQDAEAAAASATAAREAVQATRVAAEDSRAAAVAARECAEAARADAEAGRAAAEAARAEAKAGRVAADEAAVASVDAFQKAQGYLEKVKLEISAGKGKLWWMDRELEEAKKYLSRAQVCRLERAAAAAQ